MCNIGFSCRLFFFPPKPHFFSVVVVANFRSFLQLCLFRISPGFVIIVSRFRVGNLSSSYQITWKRKETLSSRVDLYVLHVSHTFNFIFIAALLLLSLQHLFHFRFQFTVCHFYHISQPFEFLSFFFLSVFSHVWLLCVIQIFDIINFKYWKMNERGRRRRKKEVLLFDLEHLKRSDVASHTPANGWTPKIWFNDICLNSYFSSSFDQRDKRKCDGSNCCRLNFTHTHTQADWLEVIVCVLFSFQWLMAKWKFIFEIIPKQKYIVVLFGYDKLISSRKKCLFDHSRGVVIWQDSDRR